MISPLAYALDYATALRMSVSSLARRGDDYRDGERAPVLLLPGVYEPWTFLRPIAERIHAAGHPVHVVRELGRNLRSIPESAAIAQRYLDQAGLRGVVLVAHSKGGLIGKHMMLLDDTEGRIDRLIAIATPFGGSRYARYMLDPQLRAFRPTEKTLAMLTANALANARITSIYGEVDTHIPEGCELPGATNIELPVTGHFRVLNDPGVLAALDAALEG
jgi:pimeloyl-ACP methyl ester carboxylesterase